MTSVQTELRSTRLCAESNTASSSSDTPHETSSPTPPPDLMAILGGRFATDVADILQKIHEKKSHPVTQTHQVNHKPVDEMTYQHQAFALARVRARNVSGAIEYIERHAPDLRQWLNGQIQHYYPKFHIRKSFSKQFAENVKRIQRFATLVPEGILVDPEAGRVARLIGQFGVYRAWVFAHSTNDGDGWVERKQLEDLWQTVGVAKGKRQARRIIQRGIKQSYWTQDKKTKRIYLFGQVRVTTKLVEEALDNGYHHLIETNKPGKRRVQVNLAGSVQEASAYLYAAWHVAKDPDRKGTTISREMLSELWQVSVPTLLSWEDIAGIGKQANFAQSNDTSTDNVPAHAYLTLNRDGKTATAWRLPNTYYVNNGSIQQHSHTGKATHIRQAVRVEISLAEQRGSIGDAALPRSGKRYFTDSNAYKMDAFKACGNYLRKLGRMNGDVFQHRYFYIGSRHGVRIYEPYNIQTNAPETNIFQRLIWQEHRNPTFITERQNFAHIVTDHHEYMALFA
ncbi:MAG: hypothetical protein AAF846_23100 [Chloroflexota bacterium]